ncbi:MAG: ECF transporter S component, partial [Clostridia bacterium]|nr:ECF transporter S component [Clostridia bacterium]
MKTKKLVVCAMLIALGSVLSVIQPFALPFGGGITLASMMPVCLIGMIYGMKTGVLSALCFSVIQMFLGASTISAAFLPGEDQMILWKAILMCLLDYTLAYTVLGLSGIFKNKIKNDEVAILAGSAFVTF